MAEDTASEAGSVIEKDDDPDKTGRHTFNYSLVNKV